MTRRDSFLIAALLWCAAGAAQEPGAMKVSLTDPSRAANLKVTAVNGSVTVHGYEGKEVVVEQTPDGRLSRTTAPEGVQGMRRIDLGSRGLRIEEQDNNVQITVAPPGPDNLVIQVPRRTSANLRLVNGSITVENVEGEIEATSTNGSIALRNISGSVIAHSLSGKIVATFEQAAAGKPMSFTSLSGEIDVTLPASARARFKMRSASGDIHTDFDMQLEGGQAEQSSRSAEGRYLIRTDGTAYGIVNGGGPDYQFTSMSGAVHIRKK